MLGLDMCLWCLGRNPKWIFCSKLFQLEGNNLEPESASFSRWLDWTQTKKKGPTTADSLALLWVHWTCRSPTSVTMISFWANRKSASPTCSPPEMIRMAYMTSWTPNRVGCRHVKLTLQMWCSEMAESLILQPVIPSHRPAPFISSNLEARGST